MTVHAPLILQKEIVRICGKLVSQTTKALNIVTRVAKAGSPCTRCTRHCGCYACKYVGICKMQIINDEVIDIAVAVRPGVVGQIVSSFNYVIIVKTKLPGVIPRRNGHCVSKLMTVFVRELRSL